MLPGASTELGIDRLALVDAVTLNFLLGNHDAHGKNFSLLRAGASVRLAPLYDLVSTTVYTGLDRKLAMSIGGEYRPDYIRRRHVDRFAEQTRLGPAAVRRRMVRLTQRARAATSATVDRIGPRPVLDRILDAISTRAGWLERELG